MLSDKPMPSGKRILILSPRFAPYMSADNQRVLAMVPVLADLGWTVCVATVDCAGLHFPESREMETGIMRSCERRVARPVSLALARKFGFSSLALRSRRSLDRMVRSWHAEVGFDLVFVSTTEFGLWPLARLWWERLRLPYVLDWQDPWVTDYYRERPHLVPPGGALKYGIVQALARRREPGVARAAAAHISVSSHYVRMLRARYPDIDESKFSVVPFPSALPVISPRGLPARDSNTRYWAYAGVCGDVMRFSLRAFFRALAEQRAAEPQRFDKLRIKFLGTSYADPGRAQLSVLPIAEACGVGDMVDEMPQRVTRREVDAFLQGAEALVIPGTDDPGYVASKIQSCLAWPKPMLTIFHADSDVVAMVKDQPGVVACTFTDTGSIQEDRLVRAVRERWFAAGLDTLPVAPRRNQDHSALAMTQRLAVVFERVTQGGVVR
jgi:Glycosyltransferase Family 4